VLLSLADTGVTTKLITIYGATLNNNGLVTLNGLTTELLLDLPSPLVQQQLVALTSTTHTTSLIIAGGTTLAISIFLWEVNSESKQTQHLQNNSAQYLALDRDKSCILHAKAHSSIARVFLGETSSGSVVEA